LKKFKVKQINQEFETLKEAVEFTIENNITIDPYKDIIQYIRGEKVNLDNFDIQYIARKLEGLSDEWIKKLEKEDFKRTITINS